jgi:hypothetical protein
MAALARASQGAFRAHRLIGGNPQHFEGKQA